MTTVTKPSTATAAAPSPIHQEEEEARPAGPFHTEKLTITLLDGRLVDWPMRGAAIQGFDHDGRMLLKLRGHLIVFSDICGWRCGWEVEPVSISNGSTGTGGHAG
jgi:hypothetical protein